MVIHEAMSEEHHITQDLLTLAEEGSSGNVTIKKVDGVGRLFGDNVNNFCLYNK